MFGRGGAVPWKRTRRCLAGWASDFSSKAQRLGAGIDWNSGLW